MPVKAKQDRNQMQVFSLESIIETNNPVRVIDLFVEVTDMEGLGFRLKGKSPEGRPAYEASTLLKLFIYGYLNRVRSSRRLENACRTNVELWWLLNYQRPAYRTIANFRKENVKALQNLFISFNRFLNGQGLFDENTVAVDGSKFGAQNSKKNNYNDRKIQQHLKHIEKEINNYLNQMETLDQDESMREEQTLEIADKLDQLTNRKAKYQQLEKELKEKRLQGQTQISTTDPDARALPKKMNIVEMSYNVQAATEAKNNLIAAMDVINENDTYALSNISLKAKQALGKEQINTLADKGYDTGIELQTCASANIITYVSPKKRINAHQATGFTKDKFQYDYEADEYICPANQRLKTNGSWYNKNNGKFRKAYKVQHYKLPFKICFACPLRDNCIGKSSIKNRHGKYIERSEYQEVIDQNIERVTLNKALYQTRQAIVEHPFGTIKRGWGYDFTLMKTMEKVRGEFALIFTCYNLRRAMSILTQEELISRLKAAISSFLPLTDAFKRDFKHFFNLKSLKINNEIFRINPMRLHVCTLSGIFRGI
jgi:transposase